MITFGGRPLTQSTTPPPQTKDLNHDSFILWDHFWIMEHYRTRAILLHERREALGERMDANVGHRDWAPAYHRLTELASQIRELQALFLNIERICQAYWLRLSATQRKAEGLDALYGVRASQGSIYGCWNRKLGQSPMPPPGMRLDQIALMFVPTVQASAYQKEKKG